MSSYRKSSLLAAAAVIGLGGVARGQTAQYAGGVSVPITTTDDTAAAHPITYGAANLIVQTIQEATVPNGNYQGAGTPYLVGVLNSITLLAHSSVTTSTGYDYSPSTGLNFFGQYSTATTDQYLGNGAFNGSTPLYTHTIGITGENAAGTVIAAEGIEAADSSATNVFGRHGFAYNIPTNTYTAIGLGGPTPNTTIGSTGASFGVNYSYTNTSGGTSTGVFSFANPANIDAAGNVSGTSNRYFNYNGVAQTSTTATLGTSTFLYNKATGQTVETGLTGTGYNYARTFTQTVGSTVVTLGTGTFANNTDKGVRGGFSVGTATPYVDTGDSTQHSTGSEPWVYSSATGVVTPVSLYQSGNTPTVDGSTLAYSYSYPVSYNNSGNTATFTGTNRSASVTALNAVGQVGGTSTLYQASNGSTSKGQDAFIYTPGAVTPYRQVGLTSNGFATNGTSSFVSTAFARSSTLSYLNVAGQSTGYSTQYVSATAGGTGANTSNNVAWFAPANGAAVQVGLTDAYHTATTAGYSFTTSSPTELTDTGLVAGTSGRYTPGTNASNGSDPWVYNSATGVTYDLDPSPNNSNYFLGSVTYLSETGYAVGQYKTVNNSAAPYSAFYWSAATGFLDLNTVAAASLAGSPFQALSNAYSIDPTGTTIYATAGTLNNGSLTQTGVAVLTLAVPEPASIATIGAVAAAALAGRRRRRR